MRKSKISKNHLTFNSVVNTTSKTNINKTKQQHRRIKPNKGAKHTNDGQVPDSDIEGTKLGLFYLLVLWITT
jgi:hypothetical protein